MASPERQQSKEKSGSVIKTLGKFALLAFGVVLGSEILLGPHGLLAGKPKLPHK